MSKVKKNLTETENGKRKRKRKTENGNGKQKRKTENGNGKRKRKTETETENGNGNGNLFRGNKYFSRPRKIFFAVTNIFRGQRKFVSQ